MAFFAGTPAHRDTFVMIAYIYSIVEDGYKYDKHSVGQFYSMWAILCQKMKIVRKRATHEVALLCFFM